jgi:hypothetical protein
VKVADFGIARIEASELTQTGAVLGSPGYMAPEQYAARAIDHRADLFAAGVVFYQLLTGTKPFVGTAEQIAYAVCHTEAPRPSTVDPGHSWQRYDAILTKALAKKPEDRYQGAEEFLGQILEAHAAPVRPAVSEETIITEILRPAAAVDPSPSRPRTKPQPAEAPAAPRGRARPAPPWGWAIAVGVAALATAAGVWLAIARKPGAPPPLAEAVPAAPAAPAPTARAQPEEVVFWESVRNSRDPAELKAYLEKYPEGTFARLARARLAALAAEESKRARDAQREAETKPKAAAAATPAAPERKAVPEPPRPARPQPDQEALAWDAVRNSTNPADLRAYLAKYPGGRFAPLARQRLAALTAAPPPVAERPDQRAAAAPQPSAPRAEGVAARPSPPAASDPGRFDGTWDARLACEAFGELPRGGPAFPAQVRAGDIRISFRTPGQPGHLRLEGKIGQDDRAALTGIVISAAKAAYGRELPARFDGGFSNRSYEGQGTLGPRKCGLTMTRAGG